CGLTGSHLGCEHGVCGACTVLVDGAPVRGCLMFAVQADGAEVRTVEGLAENGAFNALQRAFHEKFALQCGYCTPGMLMLATWLVERGEPVGDAELREVMASNLCRCTGYRNILRAVRAVLDGEGAGDGE
ncbi:MAG: (2Fe-2S)-binding protein, partial [Alphaproteobacteria bacterium]